MGWAAASQDRAHSIAARCHSFLTRHVALLSALPSWRLRLLIPAALSDARAVHIRAVHQVLDAVAHDDVEAHVELVPVTKSYLRLERPVGTALRASRHWGGYAQPVRAAAGTMDAR